MPQAVYEPTRRQLEFRVGPEKRPQKELRLPRGKAGQCRVPQPQVGPFNLVDRRRKKGHEHHQPTQVTDRFWRRTV